MTATARKSPRRTQIPREENGGFTVNERLTPKRPIETGEYAAMVQRITTALGRRVGAGDLEGLIHLVQLQQHLAQVTLMAVADLGRLHGYSWAQIGGVAGITKQAAQQRWGRQ